ncbi:hypothetical protein GW17_00059894 [Ensete ventricosum]|nr:hypothetical protein GW17_00059894 [Ensete ventricosum]
MTLQLGFSRVVSLSMPWKQDFTSLSTPSSRSTSGGREFHRVRDSDSLSSKVLLAQVANQKVWVSVNSLATTEQRGADLKKENEQLRAMRDEASQ